MYSFVKIHLCTQYILLFVHYTSVNSTNGQATVWEEVFLQQRVIIHNLLKNISSDQKLYMFYKRVFL